jgi:hypothetical protein
MVGYKADYNNIAKRREFFVEEVGKSIKSYENRSYYDWFRTVSRDIRYSPDWEAEPVLSIPGKESTLKSVVLKPNYTLSGLEFDGYYIRVNSLTVDDQAQYEISVCEDKLWIGQRYVYSIDEIPEVVEEVIDE